MPNHAENTVLGFENESPYPPSNLNGLEGEADLLAIGSDAQDGDGHAHCVFDESDVVKQRSRDFLK